MKQFLIRVARVISCVLLPVGSAFLAGGIILMANDSHPLSFQGAGRVLAVGAVLCILPVLLINSTEPLKPGGSNIHLIKTLALIGAVPMFAVFLFFTLVLTHD